MKSFVHKDKKIRWYPEMGLWAVNVVVLRRKIFKHGRERKGYCGRRGKVEMSGLGSANSDNGCSRQ